MKKVSDVRCGRGQRKCRRLVNLAVPVTRHRPRTATPANWTRAEDQQIDEGVRPWMLFVPQQLRIPVFVSALRNVGA